VLGASAPGAYTPAMRFAGKVALVTGAASGIGAATARALAAEGANLTLLDLRPEPLEALAEELDARPCIGDAADPTVAANAVATSVAAAGGLDVLITCAGADVGGGPLGDLSDEDWDSALRANLESCVVTVRAALDQLSERRGAIVMVASIGALSAGPGLAGYVTAKSGLLALTRSLAIDYGPLGVRVNAVCPGFIRTPMLEPAMAAFAQQSGVSTAEMYSRATGYLPLRRAGEPSEIASVSLFLASEDASFVTGSYIVVDGGTMATNVGTAPLMHL
jgi:meso-butanediol dehydrogenase / (S,S)-butanediol dehydrogenase / diacetyl reductase